MNTRTFEIMSQADMLKEIEESEKRGREPDTYIPVGNETRQQRRARERAAEKALRRMSRGRSHA